MNRNLVRLPTKQIPWNGKDAGIQKNETLYLATSFTNNEASTPYDLLERTSSFLIFQIPNRRNMLGNAQFVIIILHISFFENLMWKKSFMSCKQFADKSIQWVVICQLFFFVCVSCAWREKSLQKLIFCINQNALSLAFLFHFTFTAHSHCFQPQILYF